MTSSRWLRTLILLALVCVPGAAWAKGLAVELWTDRGNDGVYQPGDVISIKSRLSEDAFLLVYEIDSEGGVHLLFPPQGREGPVEGGRDIELPDDNQNQLVVDDQTGQGFVVAIASRAPFDSLPWYLRPVNPQAEGIGYVGQPDEEEGVTSEGKIVGEKMSKSLDNYVGISEPADQVYGKLMSISDELMWRYHELLSSLPLKALGALRAAVEKGEVHPKDAKSAFAREIAARFCGDDAAEKAAADFDRRFARTEIRAEELPLIEVPLGGETRILLSQAIAKAKLASSSTEARRLIAQGGVKLNQEKVSDPRTQIGPGDYLLQVGKLRAARVRIN